MHDQPIPVEPDDAIDTALLDLLVHEHCGLWSVDEVSRALGSSAGSALGARDAIERLHASGLIHRCGDFVFASRVAHAIARLNHAHPSQQNRPQ